MTDKLNPQAMAYFRKHGARGGRLGAKARMVKLTPEQRSEIARNAVRVREENRAKKMAALAESVTSAKKQGPKKKRKAA